MQPALLPSCGRLARFFDPRFCAQFGAATARLAFGQPCLIGTTTERAAWFGPFRRNRRNSSGREVCPLMVRSFRRCPISTCRRTAQEQSRESSCQRPEPAWAAHGGPRLSPDPRIDGPHLYVVRLPEVVCV